MNSKTKKTPLSKGEWQELSELYRKAMDLPPEERHAFAEQSTAHAPRLLEELLFLMQNSSVEDFLEESISSRIAIAYDPQAAFSHYAPGKKRGDFDIIRLIGAGAFAQVYLARQMSLDREVALKASPLQGGGGQELEAKTLAQLEHDHIIKVFSEIVDAAAGLRVICMQYVAGVGLEKIAIDLRTRATAGEELKGSSFLDSIDRLGPPATAFNAAAMKDRDTLQKADFLEACLWIGARLADALGYAHGQGVLHLDVKPSNILVNLYGRPMLTDFNISADSRSLARGEANAFGGTFNYMPPEQKAVFSATNRREAVKKIDIRADLYSLGIIIKELITGVAAKGEGNPLPRGPQRTDPGTDPLPIEVAQVLDRATAPDAKQRFGSAQDLGKAFEACLELRSIAKALPPPGRFLKLCMRYPLLAVTLIGAVPQFLASYLGISYNSIRIVGMLTQDQQRWFHILNLTYNPIVYASGLVLWVSLILRLRPYLQAPYRWRDKPRSVTRLRSSVLKLPYWGVVVTTFGWVPGSVIFPLTLSVKAGPLPRDVFGHFLTSFLLSWLVAMAYSFLLHQLIVLRVLYPRFWIGCTDVRRTARAELARTRFGMRIFFFLTGLIPLAAATILIFVGPDRLDTSAYASFRILVGSMMGMGVLGVFFAFTLSGLLSQALFALTGVQNVRTEMSKT